MLNRHLFLPRTEVSCLDRIALVRDAVSVSRGEKLANLELGVRDGAPGDAGVRSAIEPAVEDVLAPAVPVVFVDVVHAAVSHHEVVRGS